MKKFNYENARAYADTFNAAAAKLDSDVYAIVCSRSADDFSVIIRGRRIEAELRVETLKTPGELIDFVSNA